MADLLRDLVVLDLSRALAGPHAAMMLGDLGATVVKVERPGTGDDTRSWGPPFVGPDGASESTYFLSCNRNKQSVTLDFTRDRELLAALVRRADVLIENFRPGVLDRIGLSTAALHALNPGLVVLSITGFGADGPERDRVGYDLIAQAEAGLMSLTGPDEHTPTRVGVPIADLLAGMYGAYGVLAALHERRQTGRGRVVRTSLLAAVVGVHSHQGTRYTVAGLPPAPPGNHHASIAPYGAFACADGHLMLAVGSEDIWQRFAALLGLDAAAPRYATNAARVAARPELVGEIETVLAGAPVVAWLARLAAIGVPAGEVRSVERVYDWDQTRSQGLLVEVEHDTLGTIALPGPPLRFDGLAPRRHTAPPTLGQHDEAVRRWVGAHEPAEARRERRPG